LRNYPLCVALAPAHRFTRLKSISLEKVAAEPLIGFCRKDYPEYYVGLDRIFNPLGIKPRVVVECDSASSLITEVEAGRGIALTSPVFKYVSGKRLLYRSLAGINESVSVGIALAKNGDVTPAGEKFCEMLRKASKVANSRTTKAVEQNTYRERG
jgi:DNA-binding transcriptional LysR family regulator